MPHGDAHDGAHGGAHGGAAGGMGSFPASGPVAAVESMHSSDGDDNLGDGVDHFSHAPGQICKKCDRRIEAREAARRKGENGWVHDVCPLMG